MPYQTGNYVNTCMDSIHAVATNYSSLFTACNNVFLAMWLHAQQYRAYKYYIIRLGVLIMASLLP